MKIIFAFLLVGLVLNAFALDEVDKALMKEHGVTPAGGSTDDSSWSINPAELDRDDVVFKNRPRNMIRWNKVKSEEWLDLSTWMKHRAIKDSDQDWTLKFRETEYKERIGKVLKCIGLCWQYRGVTKNPIEYNSNIYEGDEVITEDDSALWVVMADGSLLRMSAKSSVSLIEINISKKEIFSIVKLNQGHIHYENRNQQVFEVQDKSETDLGFYPLELVRANRQYFMIQEYRKMKGKERLVFDIAHNPGHQSQYEKLNELIKLNNEFSENKINRFYIYTPNLSLSGHNANIELSYYINHTAHFKYSNKISGQSSVMEDSHVDILFRGYNNKESQKAVSDKWYQMSSNGLELSEYTDGIKVFSAVENFTKRIPTIHLAREFLLQKMFKPIFETDTDFKQFASMTGYRLWDELSENEMERRYQFVQRYVRRVETTHLKMLKKYFESDGKTQFGVEDYKRVMKRYYDGLKRLNSKEMKIVREMSDTQYLMWARRYGK